MKYGLSPDEFYRTNPKELERRLPFLAERYRQGKNHMSEVGWMNGHYVARAIGACFPKGKKYPDEYIEFYQSEEVSDADRFWAFAQTYNSRKVVVDDGNGHRQTGNSN